MVTDTIADLLTRIRNAKDAGHQTAAVPASKKKEAILKLFVEQGYIASFEEAKDSADKPIFRMNLRYTDRGESVIREVKRISKPGCRVYVGKEDIPNNRGGLGTVVVSTSKGLMTDAQARKEGIGGELICSIF